MNVERAFELAERGLDSGDQEVLLSAIHLFEAVLSSTTDAKMRQVSEPLGNRLIPGTVEADHGKCRIAQGQAEGVEGSA